MLRIAVQSKGRLFEETMALLQEADIKISTSKRILLVQSSNFPIEVLFLRDDDIPEYVQDGIADLGIVGENVIEETEVEVSYLQRLGFGKCSLKIAVPNNNDIATLEDLNGKAIATTYPVILGKFLKEKGIQSDIRTISGSVEISPGLGLSDAICDLVSTGGTLKSNGLKAFADVMSSEAILISSKATESNDLVQELIQRIQSVLRAKETKYVVLNVKKDNLDAVTALLPGVKSPSVVPLAEADWVAVHTVIPERDFWDRISQLKQAGAQGIVVMPIEKIIL